MNDEANGGQAKRLNNMDFFRVCNELINRREEATSTCHTAAQLSKYLSDRTGLGVSESTVKQILKSTGVELTSSKKIKARSRTHHTRVIGSALLKLYNKLGETPPQNLIDTMVSLTGKNLNQNGETDATKSPVVGKVDDHKESNKETIRTMPVKSIPNPNTIRVVS